MRAKRTRDVTTKMKTEKWKLAKSENQAETWHSFPNRQLTQFCVSSIHIPSSMRKGIKLRQVGGPSMISSPKYLDFQSWAQVTMYSNTLLASRVLVLDLCQC